MVRRGPATDHFGSAIRRLLQGTRTSSAQIFYLEAGAQKTSRRYAIDFDQRTSCGPTHRLAAPTGSCNAPDAAAADLSLTVCCSDLGSLTFHLRSSDPTDEWRSEVGQRIRIAAPALAQLAEVDRLRGSASSRLQLIEGVLDEMSLAVFVLDAEARPLCLNAAAHSRLAMADAFLLSAAGTIGCASAHDSAALRRAVRTVLSAPADEFREESLVVTTRGGERLVGIVRAVAPRADEPHDRAAMLTVQHEVHLSRAAFAALGLTTTEQKFLTTFLYCSDLGQTADRLGLSEETTRTYLKRVCAKLGVRKQVELAAFIWNLLPPLRRRMPEAVASVPAGALGRLSHLRSC